MKRIAVLVASLMLLTFVAGCGKNAVEPGAAPASGTNVSSGTSGSSSTNTAGNNSTTTNNNTSTNTALPPAKEQTKTYEKVTLGPLKKGDTAKVGPISYTLSDVNVVTQAAGLPQGYVYLLVKLTVANEDPNIYTINVTDHLKMETPEKKSSRVNVTATAQRNPRLQGSVEQGKSASGWLGYLTKKMAGNYTYTFTHPDFGEATWQFDLN